MTHVFDLYTDCCIKCHLPRYGLLLFPELACVSTSEPCSNQINLDVTGYGAYPLTHGENSSGANGGTAR